MKFTIKDKHSIKCSWKN